MKRPILILIPVLLLALTLIYRVNEAPKPTENAKPVPIRDQNRVAIKTKSNAEPEIPHFSWREVESEDYRQYVANLRRINVPELTVADIIVADVNRLFAERAVKLKADNKELLQPKFWQVVSVGTTNRTAGTKLGMALQSLNLERVRLIHELLGKEITDPLVLQQPDAFKTGSSDSIYSVDFLPEPKQRAYHALQEASRAEMLANIPDGATDERAMLLRKSIAEKYDAELTKILSPAEKLEYDARFSQAGQRLRALLCGMQPTPEEFLQMVSLGRRYYEEYENVFLEEDPMKIPDKLKAKREMNAQLEQALGAERFQQLQRGWDGDYGRDTRFVTGLGLNQDMANELYRLREDLRRSTVLKQPSEQNLEAAKSATLRLLGEETYQRYTSRGEGRWLTGLPNSLAPIMEINVRAVQNR